MTAKFVVEAEGITAAVGEAIKSGRILLTDELLNGCIEVRKGAGGTCSLHQDTEWFFGSTSDEDDIEPTDEWDEELRAERLRH